jgi:hypothetical protein
MSDDESTKNDVVLLDMICQMLEDNEPNGLNWPGVARLIRKVAPQTVGAHADYFTRADWKALAAPHETQEP